MQLLRMVLLCVSLLCFACHRQGGLEQHPPVVPGANQAPAPSSQCTSADFVVFSSEQAEGLRCHGVRLVQGRKNGSEIHFDIGVVGAEEDAKVALVAVEYFYTQQSPDGKVEHYKGRFTNHDQAFFAVLVSEPYVSAETLVSDEPAQKYLTQLFADGEKICAEIEAKMQSDEPTETQKHDILLLFQGMVARQFCQRQTLDAWGSQGRVYFPLWQKPMEKVVPPTPTGPALPTGGQIAWRRLYVYTAS